MQANDFENKIKSQLDEFTLVPKEEVWDLVAARIAKEEKRIGVIFWFFLLSILAIGVAAWTSIGFNKKVVYVSSETSTLINIEPKPKTIEPELTGDNKIVQTPEKFHERSKIDIEEKTLPIKAAEKASFAINKANPILMNKLDVSLAKDDHYPIPSKPFSNNEALENALKFDIKPENQAFVQEQGMLHLKKQTTITSEPKDSSSNVNPVAKEALKKQLLSNANSKNKSEQAKTSKNGWKTGFTAFAGISNNQPGLHLINKQADSYEAQVNTTGGQSSTIPKLTYMPAVSFGVGVFAIKKLSNKMTFSIGGDYHFYQANSKVGSKYNGILNAIRPTSLNQSIVTEYYSFGNTNRFSNKYHLVEMPIQLSFRLNKQKKTPVAITTSLIPGYLFGSSALYANANSNAYYVEKEQFRQFQLFAAVGLMFSVKKAFDSRLSIGPVFQYNLTNMTKGDLQSDQHLLFGGIKTNFILK